MLDHSECAEHLECDYEAVQQKLFDAFHDKLNEHWQTKKIQESVNNATKEIKEKALETAIKVFENGRY